MEERIPITRMQTGTDCDVNYYAWSGSRISTILRNPFYKGAHVVCKTHQKGIRSNTYNIIPREQREVIEDERSLVITQPILPASISLIMRWNAGRLKFRPVKPSST